VRSQDYPCLISCIQETIVWRLLFLRNFFCESNNDFANYCCKLNSKQNRKSNCDRQSVSDEGNVEGK
jgi:hypothetical protein